MGRHGLKQQRGLACQAGLQARMHFVCRMLSGAVVPPAGLASADRLCQGQGKLLDSFLCGGVGCLPVSRSCRDLRTNVEFRS